MVSTVRNFAVSTRYPRCIYFYVMRITTTASGNLIPLTYTFLLFFFIIKVLDSTDAFKISTPAPEAGAGAQGDKT